MNTGEVRLLRELTRRGGWTPASVLADSLGVTTRSIRNYVANINKAAEAPVVDASARGYRLHRGPGLTPTGLTSPRRVQGPAERLHRVLRAVVTSDSGVDVHKLADELGVSSATIEADLGRARPLVAQHHLSLVRDRERVILVGSEADTRRLIGRTLADASTTPRLLELSAVQEAYPSYDMAELKDVLLTTLQNHGLDTNVFAVNALLLHLVIAIDRISEDRPVAAVPPIPVLDDRVEAAVHDVAVYLKRQYGVLLDSDETDHLTVLVAGKTTTQLASEHRTDLRATVGEPYVSHVRRILSDVGEHYMVAVEDDELLINLALHVRTLVQRASSGSRVANPLAARLKVTHPLVHELAVFIARRIELLFNITVSEDEIGFLGFHIGGYLERQRTAVDVPTVALVMPDYQALRKGAQASVEETLGERANLVQVITEVDVDPKAITADIVVSPVELAGVDPTRTVIVSPFLTQPDLDRIAAEVRQHELRTTLERATAQVQQLLDPAVFFRTTTPSTQAQVLRELADAMEAAGLVPQTFHDEVVERERLSSTAFHDVVALPHAMTMTAYRSSIAVLVTDEPIDWAGTPVNLVTLIAFNADERQTFRDVFDQLVVVLTEPGRVRRLIRRGTSYDAFVSELVSLMEL